MARRRKKETDLEADVARYRMSLLGRRGGRVGGPARAAALTPKERREIAKKAARARWKDHKPKG